MQRPICRLDKSKTYHTIAIKPDAKLSSTSRTQMESHIRGSHPTKKKIQTVTKSSTPVWRLLKILCAAIKNRNYVNSMYKNQKITKTAIKRLKRQHDKNEAKMFLNDY